MANKRPPSSKKKKRGGGRKRDMTDEQSFAMFPGAAVSYRAPWAHLIAAGHKRCENRHIALPDKWEMKPVAVHISQSGTKKSFQDILKIASARRGLSRIERFNNLTISDTVDELNKSKGCIIGLVWFSKSPMAGETYPFKNVPTRTKYHWYIHGRHMFNQMVYGHSGSLNFHHIVLRSVMRDFLAQIPVMFFMCIFACISFHINLFYLSFLFIFSNDLFLFCPTR